LSNFFSFFLRVYSFVFHLTLSAFLIALALIDYRSQQFINLDILPFSSQTLLRNTILLGATGIACTLLSLSRWFQFVFVLWSALALWLMLKWFFLGDYIFDDAHQSRGAIWLTFGALGAFFGAAWSLKSRKRLAIL
jgi:hypothetical protein